MIKLFCSEMAGRVADRAVQVFGGRGYMRENVAERFYRELRVERIWEGTSEIQRMIIAGQLTRRGPSALAWICSRNIGNANRNSVKRSPIW
jgi:acyl-CoA dehydrogenase